MLDDGCSPVLHFPRTERIELRAEGLPLVEGEAPSTLALGSLRDGRILRAIIRSPVQ